jgi:plastocyanin
MRLRRRAGADDAEGAPAGPAVKLALATVALVLAAAPAAVADQSVVAAPVHMYLPADVTMDQGEPLTFKNQDFDRHDVASQGTANGQRLFSAPVTDMGGEIFVEGSQYLTTGDYPFFCRIHPEMVGTLHVTAAGTPVSRPRDTRAPSLSVRVLDSALGRVQRRRKLRLKVRVDEAATVRLTARARGRKLGSAKFEFNAPGAQKLSLRLTKPGRRLMRNSERLRVSVSVVATDEAGNDSSVIKKKRLRR